MARPLPTNPPSGPGRPSLTMQFASMGLQQDQQWAAPLPTPPQVSPTGSSMGPPPPRPRPMSMAGSSSLPGGSYAPPPMHRSSSSVSGVPRPTSMYDGRPPVRHSTLPAQPMDPRYAASPPQPQPQPQSPYGSQYQPAPPQQQPYQEHPHPQARTAIHPQAQALASAHPQTQILQRQYQQEQKLRQEQQMRQSQLPSSMRAAQSSGFQPGTYSPASPSSQAPPSPARPTFTPTSSFPNGPPSAGFPRPGGTTPSGFVNPPPRPPSMAPSYSQPAQPSVSPRPPAMSASSYSQPGPARMTSQQPQIFPRPPSHPASPTRSHFTLPPSPSSEFPPPPVHPDSPTRRTREISPMRSRDSSPMRYANAPSRDPSPQRPLAGRGPSPFRGEQTSQPRQAPQSRDPSPRRQLPQPSQTRPGHSPSNSFSQPPVPVSSFPAGMPASAMEQIQKSMGTRGFPTPPPSHAPTITQSRPLPGGQYGRPGLPRQQSSNTFPQSPRSHSQNNAPTIREPSPTRPIRLPDLDDPAPSPVSPRMHSRGRSPASSAGVPRINIAEEHSVPQINVPSIHFPDSAPIPSINLPDDTPVPTISFSVDEPASKNVPKIDVPQSRNRSASPGPAKFDTRPTPSSSSSRGNGLTCARCGVVIIGRMVSSGSGRASLRWHPDCFACAVCGEHLEHVSSYERDGRMYCHLDYHEKFAPSCSHCCTPIIDEEYISLDEPGLGGTKAYHAQHFFCAECGDPFLQPGQDLASAEYIIHRGYAYCEACHVRLRMPLCRRVGCNRRIREWEGAIEALGGKWCNGCFRCQSCQQALGDSFFQRGKEAFCYECYDIMLRNEV